ncbi:MAG: GNAT family N-acetyltransferase [Bdellovibrionales bacterium]|nr:GNAT family N-acetyltransferase [Bdellovibrionales bacterium]
MKKLNEWNIQDNFCIAEVDEFPNELYRTQLNENLMNEYPMLPWRSQLDDIETEKVKKLKEKVKDKYELRLALLNEEELVGWTYGWQEVFDHTSFFMGASMVLPKLRRQGLYSKLVEKVLEITKELGFQSVWSSHIMTNNPVIIAKLRLGFTITGFESNVNYGNLVKLTYHHSELRKKATKFRAGAVKESEVLKLLLQS